MEPSADYEEASFVRVGCSPCDIAGQGWVAGFPGVAEDVGELEVWPFGTELREGDDCSDDVCGAEFEQVEQDATACIWLVRSA